jgi:hypothetical protein
MTSIKLYCITSLGCVTFGNEKAPTTNRGLFGVAWERLNVDVSQTSVIIAFHAKVRNTFMECYV